MRYLLCMASPRPSLLPLLPLLLVPPEISLLPLLLLLLLLLLSPLAGELFAGLSAWPSVVAESPAWLLSVSGAASCQGSGLARCTVTCCGVNVAEGATEPWLRSSCIMTGTAPQSMMICSKQEAEVRVTGKMQHRCVDGKWLLNQHCSTTKP